MLVMCEHTVSKHTHSTFPAQNRRPFKRLNKKVKGRQVGVDQVDLCVNWSSKFFKFFVSFNIFQIKFGRF